MDRRFPNVRVRIVYFYFTGEMIKAMPFGTPHRMYFMGSVFGSLFDKFGARVGLLSHYAVTSGAKLNPQRVGLDYNRWRWLLCLVYAAKYLVAINSPNQHRAISRLIVILAQNTGNSFLRKVSCKGCVYQLSFRLLLHGTHLEIQIPFISMFLNLHVQYQSLVL